MADPAWTDNVTPLNAVNMTKLQTRDEKNAPSGYVGLDAAKNVSIGGYFASQGAGGAAYGVAAAGDTANRYLVDVNGLITWGPGNAPGDVTFQRWAANQLRASGDLLIGGAHYVAGTVTGSSGAASQVTIGNNGFGTASIMFGLAADSIIYRQAAGLLATGGEFHVRQGAAGQISISTDPTTPYIYFGSGGDTTLYRNLANSLRTGGQFWFDAAGYFNMAQTADKQVFVGQQGGGPGLPAITLGGDTFLYRYGVNTLRTDGRLFTGDLSVGYFAGTGITFGNALDTNLYRSAAGYLKTDGGFQAVGLIRSHQGLTDQVEMSDKLYFGVAADTNLYRSAAQQLTSDNNLNVRRFQTQKGQATEIALWEDGKLYFGSASDTNLYRSAANTLSTSSIFTAPQVSVYNAHPTFPFCSQLTLVFSSLAGARLVQVGPADSGGAGNRVLTVTN